MTEPKRNALGQTYEEAMAALILDFDIEGIAFIEMRKDGMLSVDASRRSDILPARDKFFAQLGKSLAFLITSGILCVGCGSVHAAVSPVSHEEAVAALKELRENDAEDDGVRH